MSKWEYDQIHKPIDDEIRKATKMSEQKANSDKEPVQKLELPALNPTFIEAVRPLMKWLAENCNPHTHVYVNSDSAELVSGVQSYRTEEFILD